MLKTPPKVPPNSTLHIPEKVPHSPHLGWSNFYLRSHDGSNSMNKTMMEVGCMSISMMKREMIFKRFFQGALKKGKESPQ